jgi:hypothetical protein
LIGASTPAKSTPAKSTPAKCTPAKFTPAKYTPAKATPTKSTPSKTPVKYTIQSAAKQGSNEKTPAKCDSELPVTPLSKKNVQVHTYQQLASLGASTIKDKVQQYIKTFGMICKGVESQLSKFK